MSWVFLQVKNFITQTEKVLGPVDILVNNAGLWYTTMTANLYEDDWDTMIDVNCKVCIPTTIILLVFPLNLIKL